MLGKLKALISGDSAATASQVPATDGPNSESKSSLGCWATEQLDGHRLDVFQPDGVEEPLGCVLFLHGHGRIMLNENETFSRLLQQHKLAAVAPDGNRSWWMNRICTEFSADISPQDWLLERVVPFVKERWSIETPKIALLGISMGGQGVLQLSFRDAARFPIAAAISPAVDFDQLYGQGLPLDEMFTDREDARQASVVLNLHPLAWPRCQWFCCDPQDHDWFDGCVRLGMKLSSSGILHERDLDTSAGGHSWDYFNHMAPAALEHIVKGFQQY